ncbi:hypothetical protein XAP6164_3080011 [Xanthomonas phaseoli pv. phaseoli]|nr:hypothetical protein XAP6164_3080011 [Xanthomonas phaseoli pv. phaseoli]
MVGAASAYGIDPGALRQKRSGPTASQRPGFWDVMHVIDERLRALTSPAASTRCSAACRRRGDSVDR